MKLYLREWWWAWYEYNIFETLSEALRCKWTERLYEIDLKDDEQICAKSVYETIYFINEQWEVKTKDNKEKNHYTFIIKNWDIVRNMTREEMDKKVDEFQKRLKKFTDIDKAKNDLKLQIKDLQNQLKELNWK